MHLEKKDQKDRLLSKLCINFALLLSNPTIFIRRVTLNTELDTVFLSIRQGQRTHFGVYPLVCPFSTWPGQGFYVELFLIGALNRLQRWQRSRAFLAQTSTYKGNVLCFFAEK